MAADRNAARRLQTLLDSETYGPALARLRGEDERRILALVEQGRGSEARTQILAADQRRRERARTAARSQLLHRAIRNVIEQHRVQYEVRYSSALRHLKDATDPELRFAATATRDQLIEQARRPPRTLEGRIFNPFWYH